MHSGISRLFKGISTAALLSTTLIEAADLKNTSAPAPANSVDSPSIGYVVRAEVLELRTMLGVPGAARFSDPIPLPDGTLAAEVAPGHAWVLVVRADDTIAYLPATQTLRTLPGGAPGAWAFSPSGSRASFYYPDRGEVALISGLPAAAKIESTLQIAQMDSFATSDNGEFVYAVGNQVLNSGGGLLYEPQGSLGPMAFEAGRDNLVLMDGSHCGGLPAPTEPQPKGAGAWRAPAPFGRGSVGAGRPVQCKSSNMVEIAAGSGSARTIAVLDGAIDQIFAGIDRIYAGNSAAGTVSLIEYADGSGTTQNVSVSRIAPSAIGGTMLVSFDSDGPAWLVSAQGVSFVPAIVKRGVQ